jgi:hypothetical protein
MIDIHDLNKADVLRVLYNNARPLGMGWLQYEPGNMSPEEAESYLADPDSQDNGVFGSHGQTRFDYLKGRVMKVDLSGDELNPRLYDEDNGTGAAARVIATLRQEQNEVAGSTEQDGR